MLLRVLILSLLAFSAQAAVTTVGTPTSEQGNGMAAATAITVPAGADVCYIAFFRNGEDPISSVSSFGGVTPGLVGSFNDAIYVYRAVSPASGLTTAQANLSVGVFWSIHAMCLDGVDIADPDDDPLTATEVETTSVSTPSITSADGDLVLAFALMVYPDIAAFAGSTVSTEEESIDEGVLSSALVYEAGAATVVTGASSSTVSYGDNTIIGFNVNAAAGGGGSSAVPKIIQQLEH